MKFTKGEFAYLEEMRALSTDAEGNIIFVGLSAEESKEFHRISVSRDSSNFEEGERYILLSDKHEIARLQVLAAEVAARHLNPTRH